MKYFTRLICIFVLSVLAACGGKDDAAGEGVNKAVVGGYAGARTALLDSLAALYPNGKLPADRAAQSAKDLAENPAVLLLTSEAPKQIRGQSTDAVVQPMALSADYKPVIRIQNTSLFGVYFFTIYDDERAAALVANPNWRQEGPAFWASLADGDGLNPVHRFRNLNNGSYLYTIYDTERTDIATNYASTFVYEGVAWYARQTQSDGWTPLYRFRNVTNGTYLFSAYESEKDAIIATYPTVFKMEGVAYYVRQGAPVDPVVVPPVVVPPVVQPTVSSISPSSATLGVSTIFTISGSNLPLTATLIVQGATCLAATVNIAIGFSQSCTLGGAAGAKTATILSSNGGTVIDASRTISAVAATPLPTVNSITPTTATIGVATIFTVVGSNLPITATMSLLDASCQAPLGNTINGFSQTCTPSGTVGAKSVTVKTASTGTVIDASRTVNVVPLPSVTTISPSAATLGVATVFTVVGTGLPLTSILAVQDATCLSPVGNTATGFAQTCTLGGAVGIKTITVKTAPAASGGTVIDATRNVLAVPVVVGPLNDTGITTSQCYAAGSDVLVSCASTGAAALSTTQDGLVGRDRTAPSSADGRLGFSYSSSTQPVTNCVTDRVTGLVWEVKNADGGLRDKNKTYTNYTDSTQSATYGTATDAKGYVDAVKALALCGYTDWRLPTKEELLGLVDYSISAPGPTIDQTWFPNTAANLLDWRYWTSSGYALDALQAWKVGFSNGDSISGERAYDGHVRLVRGNRLVVAQRYFYSADGLEVNDILTGLTWRRCPEGYYPNNTDATCVSNYWKTFTHAEALAQAMTRSTQTAKVWRIPNAKELMSITDVTKNGPPFDTTIFPNNNSDIYGGQYWTSTPYVGKSKGAWVFKLSDGTLTPNRRTNLGLLRLVRDIK